MMNIKYTLEFFSDWHCGSGLAAGADVDLLVVKDKDGLPFVPGKTIKGLIREAVEDINQFSGLSLDEKIKEHFGFFDDKDTNEKGDMFFSNAVLPEDEHNAIVDNNAVKYMFRSIASTAIDENGIAKDHSLRKMEVTIPCTLSGDIYDVPDCLADVIYNALRYIKRLGQNRNRGLGRCKFEQIEPKRKEDQE